jgi:hypothetical protein
MRKGTVCSLLLYLGCVSGLWAQAFQNLDFESANVSNLPPNQVEFVSVADGLPGWTAYIGTNELTQASHNLITLGAPNVGVLGPQYYTLQFTQALQGSYSAIIQAGYFDSASIAQTGLIPASVRSVQFIGTLQFSQPVFTNSLFVTIGGQNAPVVPLGNNLYGCDVSAFAGSVESLEFTMSDAFGNGLILLDAITFSPEVIPEPSSLLLTAGGVLTLLALVRRKRA